MQYYVGLSICIKAFGRTNNTYMCNDANGPLLRHDIERMYLYQYKYKAAYQAPRTLYSSHRCNSKLQLLFDQIKNIRPK